MLPRGGIRRDPLIAAPDRLAREYVHRVPSIEELRSRGRRTEFVERPTSSEPNDRLSLRIRGAVAEYERTLIAERKDASGEALAKLRAGQLLPWMTVPFGYRTDPERPRDPAGLRG
jgi:site-specific DNA recombinase